MFSEEQQVEDRRFADLMRIVNNKALSVRHDSERAELRLYLSVLTTLENCQGSRWTAAKELYASLRSHDAIEDSDMVAWLDSLIKHLEDGTMQEDIRALRMQQIALAGRIASLEADNEKLKLVVKTLTYTGLRSRGEEENDLEALLEDLFGPTKNS